MLRAILSSVVRSNNVKEPQCSNSRMGTFFKNAYQRLLSNKKKRYKATLMQERAGGNTKFKVCTKLQTLKLVTILATGKTIVTCYQQAEVGSN